MKYTNVNYKESNKERDERFKRSIFVMQEIANNAEPTSKNISYALGLKEGVVTDKVVTICEGIVINSITLPLPNYNSANSELFRSVVGSSSSTGNKVPGCYLLHSQDPTKDTYIGQSKSLAQRVREHANGSSNVQNLIKDFGNKGIVTLFIIPEEVLDTITISKELFITILEQYLFFYYKPTYNKMFVAGTNIVDSNDSKFSTTLWSKLYIYSKEGDTLTLIQIMHSTAAFSRLMSKTISWARGIVKKGGWIRDTLFISNTPVPNANINTLLTLTELKSIVDNVLKLPITLPISKNVKVTNTFTNEILYFDSLGKAAIHFNKPPSSLSRPVNLNTLYLKK